MAIDGPAGSGKSTLAGRLAAALGLAYVNTGLMYRALTLEARSRGIDPGDGPALAEILPDLRFEVAPGGTPPSLLIGGRSPRPELTAEAVERDVSEVSRHPEVREGLCAIQRDLGMPGAVMEGRDIGSVVFPGAEVKIFLDAAPDERADRRVREREAEARRGGIAGALASRDALDATVNPPVPAADATHIDTTGTSPDEVFERALAVVRERLGATD